MKLLVVGLATFDQMTGGSARYMSGMIDALREAAAATIEVLTAGTVVQTGGSMPPGSPVRSAGSFVGWRYSIRVPSRPSFGVVPMS